MSEEKKPAREFWTDGDNLFYYTYPDTPERFRLIEYSAYLELEKQRDELKAQLESAREVIKKYDGYNSSHIDNKLNPAREWLEKNGGEK